MWFWFYRDSPAEHSGANDAEPARWVPTRTRHAGRFHDGAAVRAVAAHSVVRTQLWLISAMYFCYAYIINIFLTWFPKYLSEVQDFNLAQMGLFANLPLMAGVLDDVAGGWISDRLVHRSGRVTMGRRVVAVVELPAGGGGNPGRGAGQSAAGELAWFGLAVFGLELTVEAGPGR